MAISAANLQFRNESGKVLVNAQLNNLFGNTTTSGGTSYAGLEIVNNNPSLTLSAVKAWLSLDTRGGSFAIAYDATSGVIAVGDTWGDVDEAAQSYTSPVTMATGIALGNLAPATKARIFCRRVVSGATVATPENNRVWVGGTSPL